MSNQFYQEVPRQLSKEDKHFIKLIHSGLNKSKAFRIAYPEHPSVRRYMDIKSQGDISEEGKKLRRRAAELVTIASKNKLQTRYMQKAITTYNDSMEKFSELSVQTAIDLVKNARSEKVRADLAIEGMRQKVGTPVQKVAMQQEKRVVLTFEKPTDDVIDTDDSF